MQTLLFVLGLTAFLMGSRIASPEKAGALRRRIRDWFAETHSAGFELRRHFFRRFFDTDLIADPNQAKVFAGGVLAILISVSFIYAQAYYHKYIQFENLDDFSPYRRASLADFLFILTLAMNVVALFTTLQWPSLVSRSPRLSRSGRPAATDARYLRPRNSLRCWPLRHADCNQRASRSIPSVVFPAVMAGRYDPHLGPPDSRCFSCNTASLAGVLDFLCAGNGAGRAAQRPSRCASSSGVSLAAPGRCCWPCCCARCRWYSPFRTCIRIWNCGPSWAVCGPPPLWFLGVDQTHRGTIQTTIGEEATLAGIALASVALSAACRGPDLSVELSPPSHPRDRIAWRDGFRGSHVAALRSRPGSPGWPTAWSRIRARSPCSVSSPRASREAASIA